MSFNGGKDMFKKTVLISNQLVRSWNTLLRVHGMNQARLRVTRDRHNNLGLFERTYRFSFSLIELLVAISIIGILAAILVPALAKSKQTAKGALCISNLKQMGLANSMYVDDYDEWLCPPGWVDAANPLDRHPWFTQELLGQYMGNNHSFAVKRGNAMTCPSLRGLSLSESTHSWMSDYLYKAGYGMNGHTQKDTKKKFSRISKPSVTLNFVDGFNYTTRFGWNEIMSSSIYRGYFDDAENWVDEWNIIAVGSQSNYAKNRHLNNTNVLFYDGHAGSYTDLTNAHIDEEVTVNYDGSFY